MYTEEEAIAKWCPQMVQATKVPDIGYSCNLNCIGSRCMAWRWVTEPSCVDGEWIMKKNKGYCGLAGKP